MKNKSGQVNNSGIHFDEVNTKTYFPGVFEIIDITYNLLDSRVKSIDNNREAGITTPTNDDKSILGILVSLLLILGHTTELLLKFKLQSDGHQIPKTHDLYVLFNMLNADSKKHIESEYKRQKNRKHPSDTKWLRVDSLLKSNPEYHTDWKYVVESNSELNAPFLCLKLAAESIYKTL